MVIDSSIIIALLLGEDDIERIAKAITSDSKRLMSSFSVLESSIVIEAKKGEFGGRELDLLLHRCQIDIIAFNSEQLGVAKKAWRKYGKGNHPAGLNIGDCCSYALAKYSREPILFKGDDFTKTDISIVKY